MELISRDQARNLGLRHFFTGEPCYRGHTDRRFVSTGRCTTCNRDDGKRWQQQNQDHKREYDRQYQKANAQKISAYNRQRYESRREWFLERFKEYRRSNGEFVRQLNKEYRRENRERCNAAVREWRLRNSDRFSEIRRRRQLGKLKRTPSWLTEADRAKIRALFRTAQQMTDHFGEKHVLDHAIPLQGKLVSGLHVPENLRVITHRENAEKYNNFNQEEASKLHQEWLKENGL